jgi:hypothetical protein
MGGRNEQCPLPDIHYIIIDNVSGGVSTLSLPEQWFFKKKKLRGLSPQSNYTDRATGRLWAKLVATFAGRGCCVVSATNSHGR